MSPTILREERMQAVETRYPLARETIEDLRRRAPAAGRTVYILEAQRGSEYGPARVELARQPLATELAAYDPRQYPTFRYQEYATAEEAFAAACHTYHALGGEYGYLETSAHPVPPPEVEVGCPVEGCRWGGGPAGPHAR